VVAVIVLLCQGTALVHAAAMPHVTCLEHGESIHLPAASGEVRAGLTSVSAPTSTAAHDHEHCNVQAQRTTPVSAPVPAIMGVCLAPEPLPAAPGVATSFGLLRFAPKTSPPPAPAR